MIRRLSLVSLAALVAACSPPDGSKETDTPAAPGAGSGAAAAALGFAEEVRMAWSNGEAVTTDEVIQLIGLNGPEGALAELGADRPGSRWTTVLAGVASADPAWLNVAAALEPGARGTRAGDLDLALKAALATDAGATLGILEVARQRLSPAAVCTSEDPGVAALLKPVVEAVDDPVLVPKRDACLAALGPAGQG
jgi:hypothetical protein